MKIEEGVTEPYITDYLRGLLPMQEVHLEALRREAGKEETYVPVVQPEVAQWLRVMCQILKPKRILEVGTAIGYSAMVMAEASPTLQRLTTIERYEKAFQRAKENIQKSPVGEKIELLFGDAAALLPKLTEPYDLIFLDAAKAQYPAFLPECLRLLNPGGVLISDNVLYKGMVANRALLIRRKITIVKRIKRYLSEISNHPLLETSIIPIGDGVALSYKKETNDKGAAQ